MSFLALIWSELKAVLADKTIVITVFGGVLFYSILYPLPYLNEVPTEQQVVVIDHDHSSLSRKLIRDANASPKIEVIAEVGSIDEAKRWIETGRAHGLLVIPADFRQDLLLGKGVTLSYGGDASYFLIYSAVVEGLVSAGLDISKDIQRMGLLAKGGNATAVKQS
ncbi:ABC transporter permease, partial [Shewanella sp. 0m-11]